MNSSKILLLLILFFAIVKTEVINAQLKGPKIGKDNLRGPVCLYKKTVQKDFKEKFGKYEPEYSRITDWYIYDKEGRKIFIQKPGKHSYNSELYFYNKEKLKSKAIAYANFKDNSIIQDFPINYYFYKYLPNNTIEKRFNGTGEKEHVKLTFKYDTKGNLVEKYQGLGKDYGYKLVYKYDSNSKKIDETKYDGHGKIRYKIAWKRDAIGNVIERVEYNTDGSVKSKRTFKYNSAGKETVGILYKSDGAIDWGYEYKYKNDTLTLEYHSFNGNEKTSKYLFKYEYDNNNHMVKHVSEIYDGKKVDKYTNLSYNSDGQKTEVEFFENQKLTEKHVFLNFDGKQNLLKKGKIYDATGSVVKSFEYKYDKYGNELSYEKYKFETSFGEKKKIPVEKRKADISYYDGNPKFTVKVTYEDRKTAKKKKEKYLSFNTKQFGNEQPKLYLFRKPGVTGGKEVEVHKGGLRSYQLSMFLRFHLQVFIVESGNYIVLMKRPGNGGTWSLENCHDFQY